MLSNAILGLSLMLAVAIGAFAWAYYQLRHRRHRIEHSEQVESLTEKLNTRNDEVKEKLRTLKNETDPLANLMHRRES